MADRSSDLITDPFELPRDEPAPALYPRSVRPARSTLISDPRESEQLADAARRASQTPPDRAARILQAERQTGLPVEVIERNLDAIEQQAATETFDPDRFRATSPDLAQWLASHPQHLNVAQDDLPTLGAMEATLRFGKKLVGAVQAGGLGLSGGMFGALQGLSEYARRAGQVQYEAEFGAPTGEAPLNMSEAIADQPHAIQTLHIIRQKLEQDAQRARGNRAQAGLLERGVLGAVESVTQMGVLLPLSVLTGSPAPMLAGMGAQSFGASYGQTRDAGLPIATAAGRGAFDALVEVATEAIPARWFVADLKTGAAFRSVLWHQLKGEVPGEQLATVLQDLSEWAVMHPEATLTDYLAARPSAAAETLITTIVASGLQSGGGHLLRVAAGVQAPRVLSDLGRAAQESKTLQRDAASVEHFVRSAVEGGPLESVGLPIDTFTTYWQSKDIDPALVAARLTGDAGAFARAQETGADLQVPTERYVTQIAANAEHSVYFANEARLAPDALNVREQAALEQAIKEQALAAEQEQPSAPEAVSAAPVREAVQALLHQVGIEPGTARTYASLYESAFGTLATRAGLDPVQLFERYGLQVAREGLTAPPTAQSGATELGQDVPEESADPFRAMIQRELSALGLKLTQQMIAREEARRGPLEPRAQRVEYERQAIEKGHPFVIYDVDGNRREISEQEEFGYEPKAGETLGVETPAGFRVLADNGGKPPTVLFHETEEPPIRRAAIQFGVDRKFRIDLLKRADLSSFIHESAHFYLEVLGDVVTEINTRDAATLTDTQRQMQTDFAELLAWLGVENRSQISTAQHEQFARGFEAYLLEGKAPSPALRSVFARVRAWLTAIYRSATQLKISLTPEVRNVMDRLLATDDAIAAAQQDAAATPLFTEAVAQAAGLSPEDIAAYRRTVQVASDDARDRLQAKLLEQLQRERTASWRRERAAIRDELLADYVQRREYRALALLQRGTNADGTLLPEGVLPFKLSKAELVTRFGTDILARLPKPAVYSKSGGEPLATAAGQLGYASAEGLVNDLLTTPPLADAVDAAADAEMRKRHGDLLLDGRLADEARQAVLDSGAEVFVAEARALERLITRRPRSTPPTPPIATLRELAARRIADLKLRDIRPASYAAAARRAGQRAIEAAGEQDFERALKAKQEQILSSEMYRAAAEAIETMEAARDRFRSMFGRDASLAQRYNMDLVFAARALLAQFDLGPKQQGQTALQYLEQLRQVDPEIYADVEAAIAAAALPAKPYRDLTPDEFVTLRDAVLNMWHTARRSKQIIVEGKAREISEVRGELENRLRALTKKTNRQRYNRALTSWEQTKVYLLGWRAALRRMESWTEAMDGGDARGLFRRMFFTPITEAASTYREAKRSYLERYLAIVKTVESSLTAEDIDAPELNYVFTGKMELLHALLHTGNQSNLRKLLLGDHEKRPRWGDLTPNGMLDTSRWDAFLRRLQRNGTLTKADYDYVQAVWDLTEELKPEAQKVHHDLFGYYFAEITAQPVVTPWATYSGGYFPVQYDPFLAADVQRRSDRETLEQTPTSFMFPTAGRGFTITRVEQYARPLALNLRVVPAHLDKVLRFIHLEPVIKDAARLATNKAFDRALAAFDPTVAGELLIPFLQRSARQTVDTPAQGWGGRGADRFWREIRRRTSMQIMTANVLNTLQQVTGLSVAALKVPPRYLSRALWRYVRAPRLLTALVTEKSAFMRTRTTTQTIEVQQTIDDLLLNPSTYEQARAFATKHGFFLQQGAQNSVDIVTWSGAYDHAITEGETEAAAVRQADAAVRATQGSFNPEDISAFEAGSPFMRAFTMFYSYWNNTANTLGTEFLNTTRNMGLRRGAGRLFYVYAFGFLIPALLGDAIVKAGSGENWDEDDDGVIDDLLAWFFGAQQRAATAMLPGVGTAINYGLNAFNDRWYDDRISVSPIVSTLESAGRAPYAVYKSIAEGKVTKREVRDVLTLVGMMAGLPAGAAARPLGYLTDVAGGKVEPENPADLARGLVTGR